MIKTEPFRLKSTAEKINPKGTLIKSAKHTPLKFSNSMTKTKPFKLKSVASVNSKKNRQRAVLIRFTKRIPLKFRN
jgi:hypothetical protein